MFNSIVKFTELVVISLKREILVWCFNPLYVFSVFFPQLDNSRLTMSCFEPIVHIYDHHENKWKSRDVTQ